MKLSLSLAGALLALVLSLAGSSLRAEDSAPSSHLVFDDRFPGDILINEVRVPKDGEATFTYYEALGWRGKGAGYAGIQAHPRAHLYIFSIWDHKAHAAPIRAVHRGPGTKTVGFGGEGTGLKSWNFDLGWSTDVWYTLVARTWPVGDHTYYGFWSRAGDTKKWTHLVTMDVAVETTFEGGTDAFIEDWLATGSKPRTSHHRGGWKRKLDGSWYPFGSARYSVNAWDLVEGKRSYNFREHWDGGIAKDKAGPYYYMRSGGKETRPTTENPSGFTIPRQEKEPQFAKLSIRELTAKLTDENRLEVSWTLDATTTPQFGCELRVLADDKHDAAPVARLSLRVPHARSATIDATHLNLGPRSRVELECIDLFDRPGATKAAEITRITGITGTTESQPQKP